MSIKKTLCLLLFVLTTVVGAKGQDVAVKTNLLYDATATVNAGFEFGLAPDSPTWKTATATGFISPITTTAG